jgi:ribosome-binding factor A
MATAGRIERVNRAMVKELGLILQQELTDPRLRFVTITNVEISRDLQHAKIFFSVLGESSQVSQAEAGLESARGLIRKLIGQRVRMRFVPELKFIYDKNVLYSTRIEETLEQIKNEAKQHHQND